MTLNTPTPKVFAVQRSLWLYGFGCLFGLGMLGAGAAIAQEAIDSLGANSSVQPAPVAQPAPAAIAPAESVPPLAPVPSAQSGESNFIDRTDYSLGATDRYEAPATAAQPAVSAPAQTAQTSNHPVLSGAVKPSELRSPEWSGATASSVQVGPLNVSSSGVRWQSEAAPTPAVSMSVGAEYTTVTNYYNRTVRPIGVAGNGDLKLLFPLSLPFSITSLFGMRFHPITGNMRFHTGTDIGAPMGTPVLAALTGRVIMSQFFGGYGLSVALEHGKGDQQTLYAHLSEVFVKPGDIVKQGTAIGRVGSTGNSTGPHLHFEVRQQTSDGWVALDPGLALETALAELNKSLQVAQAPKDGKTQ